MAIIAIFFIKVAVFGATLFEIDEPMPQMLCPDCQRISFAERTCDRACRSYRKICQKNCPDCTRFLGTDFFRCTIELGDKTCGQQLSQSISSQLISKSQLSAIKSPKPLNHVRGTAPFCCTQWHDIVPRWHKLAAAALFV